jgi:hypothetical protein
VFVLSVGFWAGGGPNVAVVVRKSNNVLVASLVNETLLPTKGGIEDFFFSP